MVTKADLLAALSEVRPARGRRDEAMARRFEAHGVASAALAPARKQLHTLVASVASSSDAALRHALLVPESGRASADANASAGAGSSTDGNSGGGSGAATSSSGSAAVSGSAGSGRSRSTS